METKMQNSIKIIKEAINKIAEVNGTSKHLFIQVLDQSLFNENMSVKDVLLEVNGRIEKEYPTAQYTAFYDAEGDSVIVVGYTAPLFKEECK